MKRLTATALLACVLGVLAQTAQAEEPPKPLPPGQVQISVEDLHCKTCAKKAARKLYALKGVQKVTWDLSADLLTVQASAKQPIAPLAFWDAAVTGGVKPTLLRYADNRLEPAQIEALRPQAAKTDTATR